jgi:hypothetical protein
VLLQELLGYHWGIKTCRKSQGVLSLSSCGIVFCKLFEPRLANVVKGVQRRNWKDNSQESPQGGMGINHL